MKCRLFLCYSSLSGALVLAAACGSSPGPVESGTAGSGAGGSPTGVTSSGGTIGSGGTAGTGGVTGSGGAGGGASGGGGSTAMGGRSGTGGVMGSGGTVGQGGSAGNAGTGGAAGVGGAAHAGVWNVMMLGDSVTESTCYPQLTYQQLKAGNHSNFQLVGMETTNQSCGAGAPSSVMDEGHAGYGVTYLPQNSARSACTKSSGCGSYPELQSWAAEKPDIVLMHYGTNDVWDGIGTPTILSAYLAVIAEFRKQNPNVIFFVSKIIKLSPSGCTSCLSNVAALAAALTPSWASTNSTATSPIRIIDHYDSTFDPTNSADTSDGVHPTPAGAAIMATVTVNAIAASGYF